MFLESNQPGSVMSLDTEYMTSLVRQQSSPSEDFTAYCEAEFERRLNSGEEFDEAGYREAMDMILKKLVMMEQEGLA